MSKRAIKDKKTKQVTGYADGRWNLQKYARLTGLVVLDIDHVFDSNVQKAMTLLKVKDVINK